ncbi:Putative Heat shock protein 70 family [Septoria linicola]|uniref:Heat shock protein 70 family n=1 Tax=Septoria linicola TaxID=215465 RepID=A0A9Q9AK07_9PEZI|nr:putative Heat shock protein 70 family [Septoria linicola]USW50749.1 Putative Heat shock protein 70 family [Septoria linicola]
MSFGNPPPYTPVASAATAMAGLSVNEQNAELHKLIISVDFGTTSTGVGWVSTAGDHVKTLADINCVDTWPGGDAEMIASRIAYGDGLEGNKFKGNLIGNDVDSSMRSFAWMKLLLDPASATKYDDPDLAQSEGSGVLTKPIYKTPVQICADFLTEIAGLAHEHLVGRLGPELLAATPMEFWFTVPAVWSEKAKADTLLAARKAAKQSQLPCLAGSQVFLIREPEAAAVATLTDITRGNSQQQIKIGESIMVVDCGGGTVDITTYVIDAISPKLAFKELLVGAGGKCGSTYIDRQFIKWMERTFGDAYTGLPWHMRGPSSRLMQEFETVKRNFGKANTKRKPYQRISCFMAEATESMYYQDDGFVKIYQSDLEAMFEPVVSKIVDLLQSQLDAEQRQAGHVTIKTMLLVGGFGDSEYLKTILRQWGIERNIRLFTPPKPQTAIVKGAALSGVLNLQPTSRRSRMHYGWTYSVPFDKMVHHNDDRFISRWDGSLLARGNMSWELEKGDLVDEDTVIKFGFVQMLYDEDASDAYAATDLYCCMNDDAPMFMRSGGVFKLATIQLDFSGIDRNAFKRKTFSGRRMRQISCKVNVRFGHRRGVLVFTASVGSKEIGTTEVTFDGQSTADVADGMVGEAGGAPGCAAQ